VRNLIDDAAMREPEANFGAGGATPNGSRFTPDANNPLPVSTQEHIINGNVNARGSGTGAHWSGSPNVQVDMTTAVRDPGGNGVFVANVRVADGNGNFVPKTNAPDELKKDTGLSNPSTFFPPSWTPERIIGEVAAAAKDVPSDGLQHIRTSPSGVRMTIAKSKNTGQIVQAFPSWPQR
jgi:Bacterial EndoU nuclease